MILTDIKESIDLINSEMFEKIEDGEISPIVAYKSFKYIDGIIKNALKVIENQTRDMVEQSPQEHKDFRISTRKTYDFKSNGYYNEKLEELKIEENKEKLKEVEKLIKTATDINKTLTDDDGLIVEPVEIKYNQILSYTPKKK